MRCIRKHHAKVFEAWLREHQDEIEVYYLPPYSQERNPDEYLNCELKAAVHSGKLAPEQGTAEEEHLAQHTHVAESPQEGGQLF